MAPRLLDHRLIFVTGKGGVGKSTVSTALGRLAAGRGRRAIVVELQRQDSVRRTFDAEADHNGFKEVELEPGLFTISVDPQHAMEEYLRVKTGPLGQALGHTRLFHVFAMATPGMRELLSVGKVWELAQLERRTEGALPYDLVVVDAPATGHGVGLLRTPRTFAEIARVGPIAHQAGHIASTIADRSFTAVVAVATPEEMPVSETLQLRDLLLHEGLCLDAVVLNGTYPQRFSDKQARELAAALGDSHPPLERAALRAALSAHARARTQDAQRQRLTDGLSTPPIELPYVFAEQVGPSELQILTDALEQGLNRR